jgi:hypothetical protein
MEHAQEEIVEGISCVPFWNNHKEHLSDGAFMSKGLAINNLMEPPDTWPQLRTASNSAR